MSKGVGAAIGLGALGLATGGFGLFAGAAGDASAGATISSLATGATASTVDAATGAISSTVVGGAGAGVLGEIEPVASGVGIGSALNSAGSGLKAALPYANGVSAAASLIGALTARRPGGLPMAPTPSPTPLLANPSDASIQAQKNAMIAALVARGGRQSTILTTPASGTQLGG